MAKIKTIFFFYLNQIYYFYRDLMDRAQAGEDILFGMPYIWPDMNVPGHEGVHRISELFARGHGYKPVPVKIFRGGYSP